MKYSYFPGCTLRTKAKDLDKYARLSAEKLGVELVEPENWQCCGGAYTSCRDEIATKLASVRAITEAEEYGTLITVCSACHNVLKRVNDDLINDSDFAFKVNNYLKPEKKYSGSVRVLHYLEMLRDVIGFDNLAKAVVKPLNGKKIACYYGCLLLRPGKVMAMDNPENPKIMEDFVRALGGEPVIYAMRNECCGGYGIVKDRELARSKAEKVIDDAKKNGADMIVTACPLCMYNLKSADTGTEIKYFTEILAEALGVGEDK